MNLPEICFRVRSIISEHTPNHVNTAPFVTNISAYISDQRDVPDKSLSLSCFFLFFLP